MRYMNYKVRVKELQDQWNMLWKERIDDKVRAEGIASRDFPELFVEKGTVILATRDYKPPCFEEIVDMQISMGRGTHRTTPSPSQGGYGKFIRDFIVKQKRYGLDIGHQNGHKR